MERIYPIFVPDESINEDEVEHTDVIQWCYNNLSHQNVLVLGLDDLSLIQFKSKVLDIINSENDSMLQIGEDDWIISQNVKENIKKELTHYIKTICSNREKAIIESILILLDISIKTNKNLYFIF